MTLAFYASLKPPDHPVPSGDRTLARALFQLLQQMGTDPQLASTLASRDGKGDATVQDQIFAKANDEIPRLIQTGKASGWRAWVTYHCYYKAPDLLGPAVSRALGIPYLQVEATRARKRLIGPWARFARASEDAIDAAAVVFYLTTRDAEALERDAPDGQYLIHLRPFLQRNTVGAPSTLDGPMLNVGMMRQGDKLASYQIIAETLAMMPDGDWSLNIAGDGPARRDVEHLMAALPGQVSFLGRLDADQLAQAYQSASLLFWPGVNEAFGLTYLEAQAHGLPIVAQDRPAVREILPPGTYPPPGDGPVALANRLHELLADATLRRNAGQAAHDHVARHHLAGTAQNSLRQGLTAVGVL